MIITIHHESKSVNIMVTEDGFFSVAIIQGIKQLDELTAKKEPGDTAIMRFLEEYDMGEIQTNVVNAVQRLGNKIRGGKPSPN